MGPLSAITFVVRCVVKAIFVKNSAPPSIRPDRPPTPLSTSARSQDTYLDKARTPIQPSEVQPSDVVVLLMGTTGSGMSNFINTVTGMPAETLAKELQSCTQHVTAYPFSCDDGRRFVFVDTPGFNGTYYSSQWAIIEEVAKWLGQCRQGVELAGVIYTRRITDEHMSGGEERCFRTFANLCRKKAADRVWLVTTMWDELPDRSDGYTVERGLKDMHWKKLLLGGARYERFDNTPELGWNIISDLGSGKKAHVFQKQLVAAGTEHPWASTKDAEHKIPRSFRWTA